MAVDRTEHLVSVRFTAYLGLPTREMQNASQTQKTGLRNPSESFGKPVYPSENQFIRRIPSDFFFDIFCVFDENLSKSVFLRKFLSKSVFFDKFLSRIGFLREVSVKNRFSSRSFCQESVFFEKVLSRISFSREGFIKNWFFSGSLSQEPFCFRKSQSRTSFFPEVSVKNRFFFPKVSVKNRFFAENLVYIYKLVCPKKKIWK